MPIDPTDPAIVRAVLALTGQATQAEPGNIDITRRPRVLNPDGSVSTVFSRNANVDGLETLIASLLPTPQGGYRTDLSESGDEAWDQFFRTGQHLGKFRTPQDAERYGGVLHNTYASGALDAPGRPNLSVNGTPIEMATGHRPDSQTQLRALLLQMMRDR